MPARGYEFDLTRSLCSLVRYRVEHSKIKFISTSGHVIFCLLYKHQWKRRNLFCIHNDVIFSHVKITCEDMKFSRESPPGISLVSLCNVITGYPEHFPKIPEDVRRLPKTFEEDPKMFLWYTNEFKYNLRNKLYITEIIDIFIYENIISTHVRVSYRSYVVNLLPHAIPLTFI